MGSYKKISFILFLMSKKLGVLFSGGKDSVWATWMAKKEGFDIACLISVVSENKSSYMFHTPAIEKTIKQAEVMEIPLIIEKTKGEEERELDDLRRAIKRAVDEFGIEGIVSGAIGSVYQASRIEKICFELGVEVYNPLWQKDEKEYVKEIVREGFEVAIIGVYAYPFDESWLLRRIDEKFILDIFDLNEKYSIHVAGEGGEFETFVLNCPLYKRALKIVDSRVLKEGDYSFRVEIEVE